MTLAAILEQAGFVPAAPAVSRSTGTAQTVVPQRVPVAPPVPAPIQELPTATADANRTRMEAVAVSDGIDARIVRDLRDDDIAECRGLPMATVRAFLRAREFGRMMDRGIPPPGYSKAVECSGCGPVLLWPTCPDRVIACPWCFRRKAGKAIPRPSKSEA